MTGQQPPPQPTPPNDHPHQPISPPSHTPRSTNVAGTIALIAAVIGIVTTCIVGAIVLIPVGTSLMSGIFSTAIALEGLKIAVALLAIALALSIVGLALKGRRRGTSIAALTLAIIGAIIAYLTYMLAAAMIADRLVDDVLDDALGIEITVPTSGGTVESRDYRATWALIEIYWGDLITSGDEDDGEAAQIFCMGYLSSSQEEILDEVLGQDPDGQYDPQAVIDFLDGKCLEDNGQTREYQAAWQIMDYMWTNSVVEYGDPDLFCASYLANSPEDAVAQILGSDAENPQIDPQAAIDYMEEKCLD